MLYVCNKLNLISFEKDMEIAEFFSDLKIFVYVASQKKNYNINDNKLLFILYVINYNLYNII